MLLICFAALHLLPLLQGRIFMTHPTKAIFYQLLTDFVNLAGDDNQLATKKEVEAAMDRIEVIDFDQTIVVDGIGVS